MRKNFRILFFFITLLFFFSSELRAQLCQGSLGDPVVNITFGAGQNPGPAVSSGTNYSYVASGCPDDGNYTVANSVGSCFNNTWHSTRDHTGNPNGYMMVVNASYTPGDFFVKKVDGLCPNTTYEFAAWIYNLLQPYACQANGIKPNITFNIETADGHVLQTYSTGDIQHDEGWKQYGFFFSTTTEINSVVLRMTNNAPGGCGNDLLLDDITFRACGPLVSANINGSLDSVDVCTGDKSVFTFLADVSSGYSDPAILDKVLQSILKVKSGKAFAERDSVLFDHPIHSVPLYEALLEIIAHEGSVDVTDFGGSLGSIYFGGDLNF